jgi:hypothetical protein
MDTAADSLALSGCLIAARGLFGEERRDIRNSEERFDLRDQL